MASSVAGYGITVTLPLLCLPSHVMKNLSVVGVFLGLLKGLYLPHRVTPSVLHTPGTSTHVRTHLRDSPSDVVVGRAGNE